MEIPIKEFKDEVEEIYNRYEHVTKKIEKIENAKKILSALGFPDWTYKLGWDNITEKVSIEVPLDIRQPEVQKLKEVFEWIVQDSVVEVSMEIVVPDEVSDEKKDLEIANRAEKVGLKYVQQLGECIWFKYCKNVYFVVKI